MSTGSPSTPVYYDGIALKSSILFWYVNTLKATLVAIIKLQLLVIVI